VVIIVSRKGHAGLILGDGTDRGKSVAAAKLGLCVAAQQVQKQLPLRAGDVSPSQMKN
jgi:hypothetical protein